MVHFWHRHVRETVVILEEGNIPHPRLPMYVVLAADDDWTAVVNKLYDVNTQQEGDGAAGVRLLF